MYKRILICLLALSLGFPSFAENAVSGSGNECVYNTLNTYTGPSTIKANWEANTINLAWYNDDDLMSVQNTANTCSYDGGITLPSSNPTKTGYTFTGWAVSTPTVPSGYTQLQYLTSTGTQYIDTSVYFDISKNFRVIGNILNPNVSNRKVIVGNYSGDSSVVYNLEFGGSSNSKPGYFRNYISISGTTDRWSSFATPANTLITYDTLYNGTSRTITNVIQYSGTIKNYSFSTTTNSGTTSRPLRFFLDYRNSPSTIAYPISIGETQMFKDGVLVGDFIPAKRNSDNVLGMWDTVTKTFLTNSGTGTFTAGPVAQ